MDININDLDWFKSSFSSAQGNCLEAAWIKSSFSHENACVEVHGGNEILIRDTKDNGQGPVLRFTHDEWKAFIDGVKTGEFD